MAKKTAAEKRKGDTSAPPPAGERDTPAPDTTAPPSGPPPGNGDPDGDADVDVRVRGTGRQVKRAVARLGSTDTPAAPPEEEAAVVIDEEGEKVAAFLADGKNMAIVSRVFPRDFAGELERYQLPLEFTQIQSDIYERFGGETFRLSIHPNTPTGAAKTLAAFTFKNPKVAWAYEEEAAGAPAGGRGRMMPAPVPAGQDPFAIPSNSPLAGVRKSLREQTEMLAEKLSVEQAQAELDSMQEKVEERKKRKEPPAERRITEDDLRRVREQSDLQAKLDANNRELSELKIMIAAGQNKAPANDNALLIAMMDTNAKQFATMMTAMQASNTQTMQTMAQMNKGDKKEGLDETLDKLAKFKSIFGSEDSRTKRMEDLAYEFMMDRMQGGGEGGGGGDPAEDDTIRYGLKQLAPILKTYVEKKLDQQASAGGAPLSEAEKKALYKEAAMDAAKDIAAKMEKDGVLVRTGKPGQKALPAPKPGAKKIAPAVKKGGPPQDASAGKVEEIVVDPADLTGRMVPAVEPAVVGSQEEVDDVDVPAKPGKEGYTRKSAIDFVLDVAITDIGNGCPVDTFIIGDIIDYLDPELLQKFLLITTGDQLEALFAPHADPEKIARLKELGQDEKAASWFKRVIVTAQDEYRQAQEKAEAKT